jgi:hypothetical protein
LDSSFDQWATPALFLRLPEDLDKGCPLSPYLFILMAKALGRRLDQERQQKNISGIRIATGVRRINHAQFADDTLLIGGASTIMARRFKNILDQFLEASGGEVNSGSVISMLGTPKHRILANIANILQYPIAINWRSFKYLGILDLPLLCSSERLGNNNF